MATEMRVETCGDCIHADLCAINPLNTKFSRDHIPEKCIKFINKNNYVELKHGWWKRYIHSALVRWKDGEPVWEDRNVYRCSCCNFGTIVKHNYCPRCGAKMDGDGDG